MSNNTRKKDLDIVYERILSDKAFRIKTTSEMHKWFFVTYFSEYAKYKIAPFQEEMFRLSELDDTPLVVIEAFRGCGKTTILVLSYILWAVLGSQGKKHILIASQSLDKAMSTLRDIKTILETNKLLIDDYGPFRIPPEPWKEKSLHLPKYDAKIVPISVEVSPRGYIHKSKRPDLIIIDDLESINTINSVEMRDKAFKWYMEEVVPSGDVDTKIVITGNFLHSDSLIKRLQVMIDNDELDGIYRRYPFYDSDNKPLWFSKFPTSKEITALKKKVGKDSWLREYLLEDIPVGTSPITKNLIKYYSDLPTQNIAKQIKLQYVGTGVDLAISKQSTAHYTAMVSVKVFYVGNKVNVYILPNPINARLTFPEAFDTVKRVSKALDPNGDATPIIVETIAYQEAMEQALVQETFPVKGIKHNSLDKMARLSLVANFMADHNINFPTSGSELLISQLLGFGSERYDDLADAFTMIMTEVMERCSFRPYNWDYKPKPAPPSKSLFSDLHRDMSDPVTKGLIDMKF